MSVYLNNKYTLDGFDLNSYAGIMVSITDLGSIFDTIRYMNDKGLERKFDMREYLQSW